MSHPSEPLTPMRVIATRVRELRKRHGWTAEQLAAEMTKVGIPWDRFVVGNFERGRRASVTVEEMLALAYVLDVAPIHLLVPTDDDDRLYAVTPEDATPAIEVREWIRGRAPIVGQDPRLYFSLVPAHEWEPPKMSEAEIEAESEHVRRRRDGQR